MGEEMQGGRVHVEVSASPIRPGDLVERVSHPSSGATVLFLGTVRNRSPGKEGVTRLEYEAYEGVVEGKIAEVVRETLGKWPLEGVAVAHRTGSLLVGEVSVGVAVSAAHRPEAFEAARYLIDQVKARAPIWKKEHWPGGAEWVREDRERTR